MTDDLIRRYAGLSVPRYTSYPTAAEFTAAVGPAEHAHWISRIDSRDPISVYLHVPYCRDLCHYCGCHAKAVRREEVLADYRCAIEAEIRLIGNHLSSPLRIARLNWGGGTPSLLGGEGLASVMDVLRRYFTLECQMEHAIELDPRYVDASFIKSLSYIGINRVSLGVQDLNPDVQQAIGRIQPIECVAEAVRLLRLGGIESINFDMIYGLPLQSVASIKQTCADIIALRPQRIACYGYAHMPGRKRSQILIDHTALPDATERYWQHKAVAESLRDAGYDPIGIDHFALPEDGLTKACQDGRLHRNFQGYTDDEHQTLIGFGASSISQFSQGLTQNVVDIGSYKATVMSGTSATARGYRLTVSDRTRRAIIERLMCDFSADLQGQGDFSDEMALLRPFIVDGIITVKGHTLWLTEKGKPFVRLVAAVFDQFRKDDSASQFSKAV